jgi:hypothetical protein
MWKLRQKILRHLVAEKSESFVLKINVSKLCEYQPEKSHVKEHVGEYLKSRDFLVYFWLNSGSFNKKYIK